MTSSPKSFYIRWYLAWWRGFSTAACCGVGTIQGWRGNTAIRWTWAGFIAILLGYIGSKVALEFLLV